MSEITTKNIRNVCLLGHGGSGKTSLAEAMLFCAGAIDRMGKVTEGNTVTDFDAEETARHYSISLSTANFAYHDIKFNLLDTPGYPDFVGDELEGIRAADASVILVDAKTGLEVGTELAWEYACREKIPRVFFVNKFDDPEADFARVFEQLRAAFGIRVCPVLVPAKKNGEMVFVNLVERMAYTYDERGKRTEMPMDSELSAIVDQYSQQFNEAIAETSDVLMEKFFAEEEITKEEAAEALHEGIISGSIVPVYSGSVTKLWGVRALMTSIKDSFPRVTAKKTERIMDGDTVKPCEIDPEGDCALFIFKTVADQFGKMSLFKVMNGTLKKDALLTNARTGAVEKIAHIYTLRGKKQTETESLCCGDIGMLSKLSDTATNDTLYSKIPVQYQGTVFPDPYMTKALSAAAKGDEDKISTGIARLLEEDPTLRYVNNAETKQLTLSGISDIHLDVVRSRLKNRYGTKVIYTDPKIPYRETIKKSVQVEGKHKKQSGGSGQYGHVKITFSPGAEKGLTFTQSVVGGTVPKGFYPAVEKGLLEAMQKGVLAGYPVVHLAADLFDGSYHAVDSNEISFKLAAKLAYKNGLPQANPVLLEPVGELKISVPDSMVGDAMGDLNKRRGRVMGMNPDESRNGYTIVEAEAPQAELQDYTIVLRAMTQGRGMYTYRFVRYEEVPASEAQKIIADAKAHAEEE